MRIFHISLCVNWSQRKERRFTWLGYHKNSARIVPILEWNIFPSFYWNKDVDSEDMDVLLLVSLTFFACVETQGQYFIFSYFIPMFCYLLAYNLNSLRLCFLWKFIYFILTPENHSVYAKKWEICFVYISSFGSCSFLLSSFVTYTIEPLPPPPLKQSQLVISYSSVYIMKMNRENCWQMRGIFFHNSDFQKNIETFQTITRIRIISIGLQE